MKRSAAAMMILIIFAANSSADEPYFPPYVFDPGDHMNQFIVDWYTEHLKALDEPSLLARKGNGHAYRFLWLRTFHEPIVIRIMILDDGSGTVEVKVADGKGGYEPGEIIVSEEKTLAPEDVERFLSAVKKAQFWNEPAQEEIDEQEIRLDGAQWILEGVHQGEYHVVSRWSPDKGPYRKLCLLMIKLGEVEVQAVY